MGELRGEWVAGDVEETVRGLNVGSGQRPFRSILDVEWVNVDKVPREGYQVDLLCDGMNLPYPNDYFDYFVLHHVLEHFGCGEGVGLLHEAWRVLKPDGSLFIFVPDMRALATRWLEGGIDTQLWLTNVYGAYISGEDESRHKWGFDGDSLFGFIKNANANWEVHWYDWRGVPGMDAARDWWILALEARKRV